MCTNIYNLYANIKCTPTYNTTYIDKFYTYAVAYIRITRIKERFTPFLYKFIFCSNN